MWLTRLALRNPILILMLSLMTVVLGLQSLGRLVRRSVSGHHDSSDSGRHVYPGAGPVDIEKRSPFPLERAVAAAPESIASKASRQGVSIVGAWFTYGTNLDNAQFEVQQRVFSGSEHAAARNSAAVYHQVRHHQFPAVTVAVIIGQRMKTTLIWRYNVIIEPQLEHHRRCLGHSGRRQTTKSKSSRTRCTAHAVSNSGCRQCGAVLEPAVAEWKFEDRRSRHQRLFHTQVQHPRELSEVIVQPGQNPTGQNPPHRSGFPMSPPSQMEPPIKPTLSAYPACAASICGC